MKVQVKYSKSIVSVDWNWPVEIGFLKELMETGTLTQSKNQYWLKRLAHVYKISRIRHKPNILVLNGTLKEISQSLSTLSFSIKSDLLVLFMEPGSDIPRYYNQTIKQLQNISYNSFFITITPKNDTLFLWLNQLIEELSHNHTIDKAIKRIGWSGKLAISKEMIQKSKVDKVLDKILDKIEKSISYEDYYLTNVITYRDMQELHQHSDIVYRSPFNSPEEIIEEVKKNKGAFQFDNESDGSTTIKKIAIRHSANDLIIMPC